MLTKTKKRISIPIDEWEKMKKNPTLGDALELLEDIYDLEKAKSKKGKDLTLEQYMEKRALQNNN